MESLKVSSLEALPDAAEKIIEMMPEYRAVAFFGAMGAGKTTLIKEIALQLGVSEAVTSPTFALVNQYTTAAGKTIYHFDFYRIDKVEEAFDLGYEEYFYSGDLCLIEWPEKIEALLPPDTLRIEITAHPEERGARTITFG